MPEPFGEPIESSSRKGVFSRVLAVDYDSGDVLFPRNDQPKVGSPSHTLFKWPDKLKEAVMATHRLQVEDSNGGITMASGPSLGPHHLLTCYTPGSSSRCIAGDLVSSGHFNLARKRRTHLTTVSKDESCGFALMRITQDAGSNVWRKPKDPQLLDEFKSFLLPCSPIDQSSCCITSFPDLSGFMRRANRELNQGAGSESSIWLTYKSAMTEEDLETVRSRCSSNPANEVEGMVKKTLFGVLQETFGNLSTGHQTASPGKLVHDGLCWTTTCSTLDGSSGGPVCPIDEAGYLCGWHVGAAHGNPANMVASCDEPSFVEAYFGHVLGDLHSPDDEIWMDRDFAPFFEWILKHEHEYNHLFTGCIEVDPCSS